MSHDTHDSHDHHHAPHNDKPVLEFKSAFYFVLILIGLFVASLSFVKSMGHEEAAGHDAHGATHSEAKGHEAHGDAAHDAPNHEAAPAHGDEHHETPAAPTEAPAEHH